LIHSFSALIAYVTSAANLHRAGVPFNLRARSGRIIPPEFSSSVAWPLSSRSGPVPAGGEPFNF
jgi:hypothetical protein